MMIYKALFPNGKMYIGQTRKTLKDRIKGHNDCVNDGTIFHKAIKKYGKENIHWEILEDDICSLDLLNERETFNILKYDTFMPNGYNMTIGGDGSQGHKWSEETRRIFSIKNKGKNAFWYGKKRDEKTIEQIKKTKKENFESGKTLPPMLGKKHSEETKEKMRNKAIEDYKKGIRKSIFSDMKFDGKNNGMFGKKHSEETKEKMRKPKTNIENMKKSKSETHIKNMSKAMKNPEVIKKILHSKLKNLKCSICGKEYIANCSSIYCSKECKKIGISNYNTRRNKMNVVC